MQNRLIISAITTCTAANWIIKEIPIASGWDGHNLCKNTYMLLRKILYSNTNVCLHYSFRT